MSMVSREIHRSTFDTGAGSQTINVELAPLDLSHARELLLDLTVTKADLDFADNLDVKFQDTIDRLKWHTRARFPLITGELTPSASAPIYRRLALQQIVDLAATEESYTPSGSIENVEPASGSVINGPFPGIFRGQVGNAQGVFRQPSWRFSIVVTDSDSDGVFEGTLRVFAVTESS